MRPSLDISAVVITLNEESYLERCLSSLWFCKDIVVVDSFSTDSTLTLAKKHTSNVFQREFDSYASQKNFAFAQAKYPWIVSLDADEEVSPALEKELIALVKELSNSTFSAFTMPRKNIFDGKWVRYGGWYPNRQVRLMNREKGQWEGNQLHEIWKTEGQVGALDSDIIHYSFKSISDQVNRNNHYSSLGAEKLSAERRKFSITQVLIRPWLKFLETYVLKQGFRDGLIGFVIAVSAAYSIFLRWAKLWEIQSGKEKN